MTDSAQRPSALEEADILLRIQQWYRESREGSGEWREENRQCYDFVSGTSGTVGSAGSGSGGQWDDKDRNNLKTLLRPCLEFNRIGPIIDSVSGMEVNNRQEVRYIPRTEGDENVNEVLTGAAQWVRDQCDAEDEESDAFIDLLVCGMGWTETRMDYEQDPDGMTVVERVDPFEMFWDRSTKRRNLDGARYVMRVKEVDITDARAMFPDADDENLHAAWTLPSVGESEGPINKEKAKYYEGSDTQKKTSGKVRIVECQWWEREPFWRAMNPMTGEIEEVSEADYKILKEKLAGQPFEAVKQVRRVYKRAFAGAKILELGPGPCKDSFTLKCMTGKRDRNKGTYYGLVRAMRDPQRFANKFMSSILHIIATSGKGILAETDSFDDPRRAEEDWSRPDAIVWMKPGAVAGAKVLPKPGGQIPAGLPDMMMQAISAIRDVSGVNLEMLGMADREQAGVLEYQRKQSAMTVLATLFDALRRYRKEQGRVLLYFIQEYMSDGRLVRISGDDKAQYVRLSKDEQTLKYDVIVDQAPTSPNQKEATWAILGQMMPTLLKLPLPTQIWVEIVKQSPLPTSFASKLQQVLQEQAQQPPPPDPEMMKLEIDKQAKAQELEHDKAKAEMQGQLEAQKAQAQMHLKQQELAANLEMKRQEMEATMQIEREKAQLDMQIEAFKAQAKAENDAKLAEAKAQQDARLFEHQKELDARMTDSKVENESRLVDAKTGQVSAANRDTQNKFFEQVVKALSSPRRVRKDADGSYISEAAS